MRHIPKQQKFESFYYNKVGLGEGCGCAERIIDNHEIDRLAQQRQLGLGRIGLWARVKRWFGGNHETADD
ncbi:hypothetical protein AB3Y40_01965 [Yoonia sp. R2331]|uniref:hypothetical protein n=1 Tax=Yoonia sp. R2331 TaxID=3237238 RepID=UPI0034E538B6